MAVVRIALVAWLVVLTGCSLLFSITDDAASGQAEGGVGPVDGSDLDAATATDDGGADAQHPPDDGGSADAPFNGGDGACADPYWSNVVLLFRFDVGVVDESPTPHNVVDVGVETTTVGSRVAAGFSGDGGYLTIPDDPGWSLGSGDFTIEAQVNTNATAPQVLIDQWEDMGAIEERAFSLSLTGGATSAVDFQGPNAGISLTSSGGIGGGTTFHHVAVVRTNGMAVLYVDGLRVVSTSAVGALSDSSQPLVIGRYANTTRYFSGYLDDIRITKGVARYTAANITPPAELPVCP